MDRTLQNTARWWVCMNIINNYVFVSSLLYHTEATAFSHTIMCSVPPNTEKNQLTATYCNDQTMSCRILSFVMPDSYMLCYIRLLIGLWLPFTSGFSPMHRFPAKKVVNWQKSPPTHTLFQTHRPLRNGISEKHTQAYEGDVVAPPSTERFGELNSIQKLDVTNTLSCSIVPYFNARKMQLRNLININNQYTKCKVTKFDVGMGSLIGCALGNVVATALER